MQAGRTAGRCKGQLGGACAIKETTGEQIFEGMDRAGLDACETSCAGRSAPGWGKDEHQLILNPSMPVVESSIIVETFTEKQNRGGEGGFLRLCRRGWGKKRDGITGKREKTKSPGLKFTDSGPPIWSPKTYAIRTLSYMKGMSLEVKE